ncbi:Pol polyprotein [Plakobranchus ocellatus]|uniref:Pol polyprotein n=1 Tax=Plakobranchus ocellatus TaxID=259542 RepID=A0AAV4D376_9GAST|nr:Pol polyprotein [Plakobranchus ocellatus]
MDISTVQARSSCHLISTPLAHCHMMDEDKEALSNFPHIPLEKLRQAQNTDEVFGEWMTALQLKHPLKLNNALKAAKYGVMKQNFAKLFIKCGVKYRQKANREQPMLPQCYVTLVYQFLLNESGHPGYQKTLALVQEWFFWPRMTVDRAS